MSANEIWLDRLYQQGRAKAAGAISAKVGDKLTNLIAVPPDLAFMLVRVMLDGEVAAGRKLDFLFSVVYFFLPFDVIPDKFPLLGKIDDLYMGISAVAKVLSRTDREILMRYWHGDPALLDKTCNFLVKVDEKIGSGLTKHVLRYVEKVSNGAIPA